MAEEEKEHPATARQRERFAERGERVQVKELSQALVLAIAGAVVWATGQAAAERLARLVRICLDAAARPDRPLFALAYDTYWAVMRPVLVAAPLVAVGVALARQGGAIGFKVPKIDLERLNPFARLGQLFGGGRALAGIGRAFAKMALVSLVAGTLLWQRLPGLLQHVPASLAGAGQRAFSLVGDMFVQGTLALVVLAAIEAWRSWVVLERRMSMDPHEVRDEVKEQVGDPQIRSRIKAKSRELYQKRMLLRVPRADVVVVNPTHLAVALLYDKKAHEAPVVLAKGAGDWAERIRAIARRSGVPVLHRPPLCRLLYEQVEVGATIPGDLYQAVAVLLAHVYRLRRKTT